MHLTHTRFFALKHAHGTSAKEERDVATIDLLGFFLQTEADDEDETVVKLTGAVVLLLVECDPK